MANEQNSSKKILDAALTLFAERGYEAASTREICELAGITKPTLYYFFKSKEAIYGTLSRDAMSEFHAIATEGLSRPGSLRDRLKRVAERVFDDAIRRPRLWRLVFAVVYTPNVPFARELHEPYMAMAQQLRQALTLAARSGEIRAGNIDTRVLVLMGAMGETISNSLLFNTPKLTRKLAHTIIDTVFDGWLPLKTRA